ncbi:mitochondrial chaperone bcs1 [Pyricularia oryzae]|nr:mitochondrial chaperone bcs1 [Pyricularia oryzae]
MSTLANLISGTAAAGTALADLAQKFTLRMNFPFLLGLLSLAGAILHLVEHTKRIFYGICWVVIPLFTVLASVPAEDRLYVDVINYLSSEDLAKKRTGTLVARTETADRCIVPFWHQKTTRDDSHDCQIIYTSKFGTRFFCHDGKPLFLRLRFAKPSGPQNSRKSWSRDPIDKFLRHCHKFRQGQRKGSVAVYIHRGSDFGSRAFWDTTIVKPQRPLSTVYLDEGEKSRLVEDIREYLRPQTRNFYRDRGVPYRRGYLLHGPPGTGKSSLSLALASEFNLDVYMLEIPSLRSDIELKALFTQLPQRCIVLLEDVDAIGLQHEHSDSVEKRSGCSLSGLLNLLDGVASPEGRILVITTNAIEKLDTALFRDGRVDIKVYLGNMDKESARLMFKTMYQLQSETLPSVQIDNSTKQQSCQHVDFNNLAQDFASQIPINSLLHAKVQGYLLFHKGNPQKAVANFNQFLMANQPTNHITGSDPSSPSQTENKNILGWLFRRNEA